MSSVEHDIVIDLRRYTQEQAEGMIREATVTIEAQAKLLANGSVDTGRLQNSITGQSSGLIGTVGTNVHYASHVEYGTRPHAINSAVHIPRVGFRYIGMHPGTRAQPFMRPALDSVVKQLRKFWSKR